MNTRRLLVLCALATCTVLRAQTLYVPSGTSGIGSSANGNVGVGTSSPAIKMEIANGDSPYHLFLSGLAPSLYFGGTSSTNPNGSGNSSAAFLGFSTFNGSYNQSQGDLNIATQSRGSGNSSAINFLLPSDDSGNYFNAMRITRDGKVGIGTSSPSSIFQIHGHSNMLGLSSSATTKVYNVGISSATADFLIDDTTAGARRLTIQSGTGYVGIGTSSPEQNLHVVNDGGIAVIRATGYRSSLGNGAQIAMQSSRGSVASPSSLADGDIVGTFRAEGRGSSAFAGTGRVLFKVDGTPSGNNLPGRLVFMTTNSAGSDDAVAVRLVARSDGSIALGGNITSETAFTGASLMANSSGNIGIGTTSPNFLIHGHVDSTSGQPRIQFTNLATGSAAGDGFHLGMNEDESVFVRNKENTDLSFWTNDTQRLTVQAGGNVGIGTTNPTQKLAVKGKIRAEEVIVETGWSDYVFADDYRLAPLSEVEAHIKAKKHLPDIPSAAEVEANGVSIGEVQSKLLAKVEELTLHLIRIEKENAVHAGRLQAVERENVLLREQLSQLAQP